jgi:hypothetical protein
VLFTQEGFGPSGFSGTRGWDVNNKYKINGAREGQNVFLLNGAPISNNDGTWQLAPNVEAVQEFKVMTNTYDAQYGRFGGGVVNTTVKSGTSDWHGDVFEYFRNKFLTLIIFKTILSVAHCKLTTSTSLVELWAGRSAKRRILSLGASRVGERS